MVSACLPAARASRRERKGRARSSRLEAEKREGRMRSSPRLRGTQRRSDERSDNQNGEHTYNTHSLLHRDRVTAPCERLSVSRLLHVISGHCRTVCTKVRLPLFSLQPVIYVRFLGLSAVTIIILAGSTEASLPSATCSPHDGLGRLPARPGRPARSTGRAARGSQSVPAGRNGPHGVRASVSGGSTGHLGPRRREGPPSPARPPAQARRGLPTQAHLECRTCDHKRCATRKARRSSSDIRRTGYQRRRWSSWSERPGQSRRSTGPFSSRSDRRHSIPQLARYGAHDHKYSCPA